MASNGRGDIRVNCSLECIEVDKGAKIDEKDNKRRISLQLSESAQQQRRPAFTMGIQCHQFFLIEQEVSSILSLREPI